MITGDKKYGDRMSFSPKSFLACCAGNVNRFMPNYVCRSWMRNGDTLAAFTYGPSEICVMIGDCDNSFANWNISYYRCIVVYERCVH